MVICGCPLIDGLKLSIDHSIEHDVQVEGDEYESDFRADGAHTRSQTAVLLIDFQADWLCVIVTNVQLSFKLLEESSGPASQFNTVLGFCDSRLSTVHRLIN